MCGTEGTELGIVGIALGITLQVLSLHLHIAILKNKLSK